MISEEDRAAINAFISSHRWLKLRKQILDDLKVTVLGSHRGLEQTALDLALKEGVALGFDKIEEYGQPAQNLEPVRAKELQRGKTEDTEE